MAKSKQDTKKTSITDAACAKLLKSGEQGAMIGCDLIPGFHVRMLGKYPTFRLRYTDATGKRREVTLGRYPAMLPNDAAAKAQELKDSGKDPLAEAAAARQRAIEAERLRKLSTLRAYIEGPYAKHTAKWRANNGVLTCNRILNIFAPLADLPMGEITPELLRRWEVARLAQGVSFDTVRRDIAALQAAMNRAAKVDKREDGKTPWLAANPIKGYVLERPEISDKTVNESEAERRLLSAEELAGLFRGLEAFSERKRAERRNSRAHGKPHLADLDQVRFPHWFVPYCLLALHTGARPGDLKSLTWGDQLNIPFRRLKFRCNKTLRSKNPAIVDMPLNDDVVDFMGAWWEQQGRPLSGLVFPSERIAKRDGAQAELDKTAHNKPWAAVKELGGLDPGLHFYCFRHHFISTLVSQGMPLLDVAKLSGHKGVSMIEQNYHHMLPKNAEKAVNIISASLPSAGRVAL